jgi:hypothetical protein
MSRKKPKARTRRHKTGQEIPLSGIYRVYHHEHRLPHKVSLLAGEIFPCCAKCGNAVRFELVQGAEVEPQSFRIKLHQIPPDEKKGGRSSDRSPKSAD